MCVLTLPQTPDILLNEQKQANGDNTDPACKGISSPAPGSLCSSLPPSQQVACCKVRGTGPATADLLTSLSAIVTVRCDHQVQPTFFCPVVDSVAAGQGPTGPDRQQLQEYPALAAAAAITIAPFNACCWLCLRDATAQQSAFLLPGAGKEGVVWCCVMVVVAGVWCVSAWVGGRGAGGQADVCLLTMQSTSDCICHQWERLGTLSHGVTGPCRRIRSSRACTTPAARPS